MIRWTKDGKVARDGWPKPQFPGDMTCMAEDLADALDVAVAALRMIERAQQGYEASIWATDALIAIGAETEPLCKPKDGPAPNAPSPSATCSPKQPANLPLHRSHDGADLFLA